MKPKDSPELKESLFLLIRKLTSGSLRLLMTISKTLKSSLFKIKLFHILKTEKPELMLLPLTTSGPQT